MRIKKMVMCGIMVIGILFSQSGLSLAETKVLTSWQLQFHEDDIWESYK